MKNLIVSVVSVAALLGLSLQAEAIPFDTNLFFYNAEHSTNVQYNPAGTLDFSHLGVLTISCPLCQSLDLSTLNVSRLTGGAGGFTLQITTGTNFTANLYQGNANAVPIPGTLLLFGAGFASLVGWHGFNERRSSKQYPRSPAEA